MDSRDGLGWGDKIDRPVRSLVPSSIRLSIKFGFKNSLKINFRGRFSGQIFLIKDFDTNLYLSKHENRGFYQHNSKSNKKSKFGILSLVQMFRITVSITFLQIVLKGEGRDHSPRSLTHTHSFNKLKFSRMSTWKCWIQRDFFPLLRKADRQWSGQGSRMLHQRSRVRIPGKAWMSSCPSLAPPVAVLKIW